MKTSQIIFLGLALFLAVQSSGAHHCSNCGLGPGTDACGCSEVVVKAAKPIRGFRYADPYVIKEAITHKTTPAVSHGCGSVNPPPKIHGPSVTDLLKPNCGPIAPRFRPIGDLCSTCSKTITEVIPAYPGKPVCHSCAQKAKECDCAFADPQHHSNSHSNRAAYSKLSSSNADLNAFEDECLSFDEQENIYNSQPMPAAPADPVSLSLAFSHARHTTRTVPEGRLNFGPKTTPVDGSIRKHAVNIPEERLLTVERPVVELIAPKSSISSTYAQLLAQQEALEQHRIELEAEVQENKGHDPTYISYSDLGYGPVSSNTNHFVNTISNADPVAEDPAVDDSACGPVGKPIPGYVSGNVIVRSEAAHESDPDYYGEGSYEQGSVELQDQYDNYSSEEHEPRHGNSGLLARLRASAHAQTGCGCGRSH